jgi:hypothetical protein
MFDNASIGADPIIRKFATFNNTDLVLTCKGADQNVYCVVPAFTFAAVETVFALKLAVAKLPATICIMLPATFADVGAVPDE